MTVKHTSSAGETDCFLKKWCLGGQGNKEYKKGVMVWEKLKRTLESIYCGLFSGPITADCLASRLTEIVIGLMYVSL